MTNGDDLKRKGSGIFAVHGGLLIALVVLSITVGIIIGLKIPSSIRSPGKGVSGESGGESALPAGSSVSPAITGAGGEDEMPARNQPERPSQEVEGLQGVQDAQEAEQDAKEAEQDAQGASGASGSHGGAGAPGTEETRPDSTSTTADSDPGANKIAELVASMTLHEKICQMLIVSTDSLTGVPGTTVAWSVTRAAIEEYPVGGITHFASNITDDYQINLFNTTAQSYAKIPMFIAADEEGGRVYRLGQKVGAHSLRAMLSYEEGGEEVAFENARTLAEALKRHGFNTDFAPVADVWSNSENTVIGDRAYSSDFDNAAILVAAAVRGFSDSGVVCTLKHFPGHGDTREDSHYSAAYVQKTLSELRLGEFKPFIAGIAAGADMVMLGHLIVPDVDELPAPLSQGIVTDILRKELGFSGVIITDALEMSAISSHYTTEFVALAAVNAGVDILLMPADIGATISAITAAVEDGMIPESRIDESVTRIIALKVSKGIMDL